MTQNTTTRTQEQATDTLAWTILAGFNGNEPETLEMRAADRCGRGWDWEGAERHIEAAYRALGVEPVAHPEHGIGYAWHRGTHPIQIRASALREERGW